MTDINEVAKSFGTYYYQTFDSQRDGLETLYKEQSMLSFQGEQLQGQKAIMEKLKRLPFQKIQHVIHSCDVQPTPSLQDGLLVAITGELLTEGEEYPLKFAQTFQLVPEGNAYWVLNDIFRLV